MQQGDALKANEFRSEEFASNCSIPASTNASPSAIRPARPRASANTVRPLGNRKPRLDWATSSRLVSNSGAPATISPPMRTTAC